MQPKSHLTHAVLAPVLAACMHGILLHGVLPVYAVKLDGHGFEADSPLVLELLRRTEQNAAANAAAVKRITEQNAFTALEGQPGMPSLVVTPEGRNLFLDAGTVARMTREGRMARGIGEPIRMVEREVPLRADIPIPRVLKCSETGRQCRFREQ